MSRFSRLCDENPHGVCIALQELGYLKYVSGEPDPSVIPLKVGWGVVNKLMPQYPSPDQAMEAMEKCAKYEAFLDDEELMGAFFDWDEDGDFTYNNELYDVGEGEWEDGCCESDA